MVYKPKNITSYENIILSNKNLSILRSKKKGNRSCEENTFYNGEYSFFSETIKLKINI